MRRVSVLALALAVYLLAAFASSSKAGIQPSSKVLVPFFVVDVGEAPCTRTTYFAVSNHSPSAQQIEFQLRSNWGVPLLTFPYLIDANAVVSVNLADWLRHGDLPGLQLGPEDIEHLKMALSGRPSPRDGLYYGTPTEPDFATGSVVVRVLGSSPPDVLWGDYFIYCSRSGILQGETLVNLDRGVDEHLPCNRHGLRFLQSETIDSVLMLWTDIRGLPSPAPEPSSSRRLDLTMEIYDEKGEFLESRQLLLLPVHRLMLDSLELPARFGWLELSAGDDFFVTEHVTLAADNTVSLGLHSYCLPEAAGPDVGIDLVKRVNGQRAGLPPGLTVGIGTTLNWEYTVTNTGSVPLTGVGVEDDGLFVTCPQDTLEPGESMICTAQSSAVACDHHNTAVAFGVAPDGASVEDHDLAYYFADPDASIDVEKWVEGEDADSAPGPALKVGDPVAFLYHVTNTGATALSQVAVSDDQGLAVNCPKTMLAPAESMTCSAQSIVAAGNRSNLATVSAVDICSHTVSDQDAAHYHGWQPSPAVVIEKSTNGEDADLPPGPALAVGAAVNWTYLVTNTGDVTLTEVVVTDDKGVSVSCPKNTLEPGESMTCTGSGTAAACQYGNVGTVQAATDAGEKVGGQDPSHYFGQHHAAVTLEKSTNGEDADTPPGPGITVGSPVQWTYLVTNTGDVELTAVAVADDQGVDVTCPKAVLAVGESMTCTAAGLSQSGQHRNVGSVTAQPPCGPAVSAQDASHYLGQSPGIKLKKLTNGEDADTPQGAQVVVGSPVVWSYVVTNTGDVALNSVTVSDDQGVAVSCPKSELAAGESMVCSAAGTAVSGQYANLGTASGMPPSGPAVVATDPSHYFGQNPGISIQKRVNGEDADSPPGPQVRTGSTVNWTYVVTNTGDVPLTAVTVSDDKGLAVTCPKTALQPGESMTCTASSQAVAGTYQNIGTARGTAPSGTDVTDSDPAHYLGVTPAISLEKLVNGQDADAAPGPEIEPGEPVLFSFVVTNTGDVALASVAVTDNTGLTVTCPKTTLAPAETMTCTATATAEPGQHSNIATASGTPAGGGPVTDQDPCHYIGWQGGTQGCTPGYWKNHTGSWPPTGYSPSQSVVSVFAEAWRHPGLAPDPLLVALSYGGGSGLNGAAEILLRAGVAALLNASHPGVQYPFTSGVVVGNVNAALATQNRDTMLALAAQLDASNNLGCPLH